MLKTFSLENGINCQLFCINGKTGVERGIFLLKITVNSTKKATLQSWAFCIHGTVFFTILASFVAQNKAFSLDI
jgi:hypothetical protein